MVLRKLFLLLLFSAAKQTYYLFPPKTPPFLFYFRPFRSPAARRETANRVSPFCPPPPRRRRKTKARRGILRPPSTERCFWSLSFPFRPFPASFQVVAALFKNTHCPSFWATQKSNNDLLNVLGDGLAPLASGQYPCSALADTP